MTARNVLIWGWLLPALALALVAGCTAQHPRMTMFVERDVSETTGAFRSRTTTDKAGASVVFDLP